MTVTQAQRLHAHTVALEARVHELETLLQGLAMRIGGMNDIIDFTVKTVTVPVPRSGLSLTGPRSERVLDAYERHHAERAERHHAEHANAPPEGPGTAATADTGGTPDRASGSAPDSA